MNGQQDDNGSGSNGATDRPPWEGFRQWVQSVGVVTFDLELGQTIEVCTGLAFYILNIKVSGNLSREGAALADGKIGCVLPVLS